MKRKANGIGYQVKAFVLAAALMLPMTTGKAALLTAYAAEESDAGKVWQDETDGGGAEGGKETETDEEGKEKAGTGISSGIAEEGDGGINPCGDMGKGEKTED